MIRKFIIGMLTLGLLSACSDGEEIDHPIENSVCPASIKLVADITQSNGRIKRYPSEYFDEYAMAKNETVAIRITAREALLSSLVGNINITSADNDRRVIALSETCGNLDKNTHTGTDVRLNYRVDKDTDSLDSDPQKLKADKTYYITIKSTDDCEGGNCNFHITHTSP